MAAAAQPKAQRQGQPPPSKERMALVKQQAELKAQLDALGLTKKVYAGIFLNPEPTSLLVRGDPATDVSALRRVEMVFRAGHPVARGPMAVDEVELGAALLAVMPR